MAARNLKCLLLALLLAWALVYFVLLHKQLSARTPLRDVLEAGAVTVVQRAGGGGPAA